MRSILLLGVAIALGGCAGMRSIDSDVSTYSRWPAERKPATYAFERLPSQQARPEQQQRLEDAARSAVEAAGFAPAGDPKGADVTVQVGARITAYDRSPFDDPLWYGPYGPWPRPFYYGRYGRPYGPYWGPWGSAYWGYGYGYGWSPYYEREAGVLIRDKRSGEPLYEARASSQGQTTGETTILPALFIAATKSAGSTVVRPVVGPSLSARAS